MKFLVTGSAGLIGSQLVRDLVTCGFEVYPTYHNIQPENGMSVKLDLKQHEEIKSTINEISPEIIIHLGAVTNVDLCETQRDLACLVNASATKTIAECASQNNSYLVYMSTNYVFDGKKGMYKESDIVNPINYYGKTKLLGEQFINKSGLIIRTSTPFGKHTRTTFPLWVINNLQKNQMIHVANDQYFSPTYVPNLSQMIIESCQKRISGIINLSGRTRISRFEFAKLVATEANLDNSLILPVFSKNINFIAKRPPDSSLDVSKADSILDSKPITINEGTRLFFTT